MQNGRSLLGVTRIRQVKIDCPECAWAKEVHLITNGVLFVCENIAAKEGTTYVLDPSDQRYELFVNGTPGELLSIDN